jgi:hypothetical protein
MAALTDEQVQFFVQNNYLRLEGAIPRELCERWVAAACECNGVNLALPSTWGEGQEKRSISAPLSAPMAECAPLLYGAICQLVGAAIAPCRPVLRHFLTGCYLEN